MGRPGEPRRTTKADRDYLKKTVKARGKRNAARKKLEAAGSKPLSPKAKGKSKKGQVETGHAKRGAKGPARRQSVKSNRGWRKGQKGDKGRAATRRRNS